MWLLRTFYSIIEVHTTFRSLKTRKYHLSEVQNFVFSKHGHNFLCTLGHVLQWNQISTLEGVKKILKNLMKQPNNSHLSGRLITTSTWEIKKSSRLDLWRKLFWDYCFQFDMIYWVQGRLNWAWVSKKIPNKYSTILTIYTLTKF